MSAAGTHGALLRLGDDPFPLVQGDFKLHRFHNFATRAPALAVVMGDVGGADPLLARAHSSCITSESIFACDCDCAEQLTIALDEIARVGRGVVFYLTQEGRGAGFAAKARDRMLVQASDHRLTTFEAYERMGLAKDHRRYDEIDPMCRLLGITAPLRLLSSNPEKIAAIRGEGVALESVRPLARPTTPFNVHYLRAKRLSGHALAPDETSPAAPLPEPVESFAPYPLPDDPSVVSLASYWLPVMAGGTEPSWFRLHLFLDCRSGEDRIVLVHRTRTDRAPLVGVRFESLRDRFPLRPSDGGRDARRGALERIREWGAGAVVLRREEPSSGQPDSLDARLLAAQLAAGTFRPLADEDRALASSLRALGLVAEEPSA